MRAIVHVHALLSVLLPTSLVPSVGPLLTSAAVNELQAATSDTECVSGYLEDCEIQMIGISHTWRDLGFGDKYFSGTITETSFEYLGRDIVRRFLSELESTCNAVVALSGRPPLVDLSTGAKNISKPPLLTEKMSRINDTGFEERVLVNFVARNPVDFDAKADELGTGEQANKRYDAMMAQMLDSLDGDKSKNHGLPAHFHTLAREELRSGAWMEHVPAIKDGSFRLPKKISSSEKSSFSPRATLKQRIQPCALRDVPAFEMSESLAKYIRDFEDLFRAAFDRRDAFRSSNSTIENMDVVLDTLRKRTPSHVRSEHRVLQILYSEGVLEKGLGEVFTKRVEKRGRKIYEDHVRQRETAFVGIGMGNVWQMAPEHLLRLPDGEEEDSELRARQGRNVVGQPPWPVLLDPFADLESAAEAEKALGAVTDEDYRRMLFQWSNEVIFVFHSFVVILRELANALLAGVSILARDNGRMNGITLQQQVGLMEYNLGQGTVGR